LGLSGEAFTSSRNRLKYTDTISEIASYNRYLEKTRIFTTAKRLVGNRSYLPDPALNATLRQVLSTKQSIELRDNETGRVMKYLFIDLRDPDYAADMSLIVELTYDRSLISAALDRMVITRIAIAALALLASSFIAILVSRRLTRPIQEMVEDADRIARGDLDHEVRGGIGKEFDVLGESINSMLNKLKDTIRMQKETESGLRASEERYHEISDLISDYAYATEVQEDESYRLEWATGAFLQIFGYTAEELLEKDAGDAVVHPEDRDAIAEFHSHMTSNQPYSREFRIIARSGEIHWVSQRNQPKWDGEKNRLAGYYVAGQDITERKKVEEQIRKLNEELEQRVSERTAQLVAINRELESFSYMVSHDLQAPLRAIDGFSHILSEEFGKDLPAEAQRYLRLLGDNAVQMHRLIEDLLNFSRTTRQSLRIERISPNVIVRECIEKLRPLWTGREVEFSIGDLPDCDADPALLRQVYMNLLSNALKFTRTREHTRIGIDSYIDRGTVVYYVKDNGVGFEMKYAERMFGVFQRFHSAREYEGTGLGLAIVQRVVHRHGGMVWAKGEAGAGATFFFTLSRKPDDD
ncbi:MAG: ATP-binding protein, partial [Methanoregulaceae archaeon]|nr:ATP-binding protein [Methanoregulaceae archaeon]